MKGIQPCTIEASYRKYNIYVESYRLDDLSLLQIPISDNRSFFSFLLIFFIDCECNFDHALNFKTSKSV